MALVAVPIVVQDPCALLRNNLTYIEVWRASTKFGTYTKISNTSTRVRISEDQQQYEFIDSSGSQFSWYKYRGVNSAGTIFGDYCPPFQVASFVTTYCSLWDVQRILGRGEDAKRIRFSDAYKNLMPAKTNTGDVKLAAVCLGSRYCGIERFTVTFSSPTDFQIAVTEIRTKENRIVGTGSVSADFEAADGSLLILSSDWSGTAVADDVIEFETTSHVSTEDAVAFVHDAEVLIDTILEANLPMTEPKETSLRFDGDTVPKAVRAACCRFAAFFIYSTVYNEQAISGIPGANINDITAGLRKGDDFSSWPRQAMKYLEAWLAKSQFFDPESGAAIASGPRWRSVSPFFGGQGVYGVGGGMKLPEMNTFTEQATMNYDGILDWDLLQLNEHKWDLS